MQYTLSPESAALHAACRLHDMLLEDPMFLGYENTKEQFDILHRELYVIARDEVSLEVEPVRQVIETWYDYQYEIMNGERDPFWYG